MTDEEFIRQAKEILNTKGVNAQVCNAEDTLYLGSYSYMRRFQLVGVAEEIMKLEGYAMPKAVKEDMETLLAFASNNDQCNDEEYNEQDKIAKRWKLGKYSY